MSFFGFTAPEWHQQALCAQTDPDAFFPENGFTSADARKVCGRCPVRDECLQWALDHNETWGVWGGVSARGRRDMRRSIA